MPKQSKFKCSFPFCFYTSLNWTTWKISLIKKSVQVYLACIITCAWWYYCIIMIVVQWPALGVSAFLPWHPVRNQVPVPWSHSNLPLFSWPDCTFSGLLDRPGLTAWLKYCSWRYHFSWSTLKLDSGPGFNHLTHSGITWVHLWGFKQTRKEISAHFSIALVFNNYS